jgi:hypothetical protein
MVMVVLLFNVIWVMLKMVLKCVASSCCLQLLGLCGLLLCSCAQT